MIFHNRNGYKNRFRAVESKENPVPIYRSYGVRKREGFFAKFNNLLAAVYLIILLAFLAVMWGLGVYALIGMLGPIGIALSVIISACLVYFIGFRRIRKRRKFLRKLKKTCRKCNFKLTYTRGFFSALRFHSDGLDFTVETGERLYCVKFIPSKKLSHVVFLDKNTVRIKTNITRNVFKLVLGFNDPRVTDKKFGFADTALPHTRKKAVKAVVLNPVPLDMFRRDSDGAVIATGSGQEFYDYTLYSGSGFINTLTREHESQNNLLTSQRYSTDTVGH
ncbi:MAG: hypothetical protein E7589_05235 [Ruminococcaceae bacterium]|nr:hypothetical protein [Oscillospiraceae bacterium]